MKRRKFVVATGVAGAIGLAGCLDGGGSGGADSPGGAVEAYFQSDSASEAENNLHPDSPIESEEPENESEQGSFEVTDTEVAIEDADSESLQAEGYTASQMSAEELDSVAADADVSLVLATVSGGRRGSTRGGGVWLHRRHRRRTVVRPRRGNCQFRPVKPASRGPTPTGRPLTDIRCFPPKPTGTTWLLSCLELPAQ